MVQCLGAPSVGHHIANQGCLINKSSQRYMSAIFNYIYISRRKSQNLVVSKRHMTLNIAQLQRSVFLSEEKIHSRRIL